MAVEYQQHYHSELTEYQHPDSTQSFFAATFEQVRQTRFRNIRSFHVPQLMHEINTAFQQEEPFTLATLPDEFWDQMSKNGTIQHFYTIAIYEPSQKAREHNLKDLPFYQHVLQDPKLTQDNIISSGFATVSNKLNPVVASSWEQWDALVEHLETKGIELIPDYIPNHVAPDHPWTEDHPDYLLQVNQETYIHNPHKYIEHITDKGDTYYFARGKHYTNEGREEIWDDTIQIDFRSRHARQAKIDELVFLVEHANIVRVDTAPLPDMFDETWSDVVDTSSYVEELKGTFWKEAKEAVNLRASELGKQFRLIGEAYKSRHIIEDEFDEVYGASLYGELVNLAQGRGDISAVKRELWGVYDDASKGRLLQMVFLSNHDLETTIEKFENERKLLASLSVVSSSPADWLVHYGEEQLRYNPPMQVLKTYDKSRRPEFVEQITSQYEWMFYLNSLDIKQYGEPIYIETETPIIAQAYHYENKGIITCTNLSDYDTIACVPVPEWATKEDIHVFDLDALEFVSQEDISNPQEFGNQMCMVLEPWGRQVIVYSKNEASSV